MVHSIGFPPQEEELIEEYATLYRMEKSEVIGKPTIEAIGDGMDIEAFERAKRDFEENPVMYSHEEVGRRLGFL